MPASALAWPIFRPPPPPLALVWSINRRFQEADHDTFRRAQRAISAGQETLSDRQRQEKATTERVRRQMLELRGNLQRTVLSDAGGVTDFRRFVAGQLIRDVDALIAQSTEQLVSSTVTEMGTASEMGAEHAERPLTAAQFNVLPSIVGLDTDLVRASVANVVDQLSGAMQPFRQQIVGSIRRITLEGGDRASEIAALRENIDSKGFGSAAFRAERIIRTEVSQIFNNATFLRLTSLAQQFPFLRKGWRTSRDSRVRSGHRATGQKYPRGKGIPISQWFRVPVFDGKGVKRIGVVQMRFPVDPATKPAGKLAAAARIMCRCNGFVDFDLNDFEAFVKGQLDLTGDLLPPPPTGPIAVPPKKRPTQADIAKSIARQKAKSAAERLAKRKAAAAQAKKDALVRIAVAKKRRLELDKIESDRLRKAAAAAGAAPATGKRKPLGTQISKHLLTDPAKRWDNARGWLADLDKVHGDGNLFPIPLTAGTGRYRVGQPNKFKAGRAGFAGVFRRGPGPDNAVNIGLTAKQISKGGALTLFHEVGHWMDHSAIPKTLGGRDVFGSWSAHPAMKKLQTATNNSQSVRTLQAWTDSGKAKGVKKFPARVPGTSLSEMGKAVVPKHYQGDGTIPKALNREHLEYLSTSHEIFARSYAQYITIKSGNPEAMKQLRNWQKNGSTGPVPADAVFVNNDTGKTWQSFRDPKQPHIVRTREVDVPEGRKGWSYPWQWSDEDFKPIEKAFDELFEGPLGWTTKAGAKK